MAKIIVVDDDTEALKQACDILKSAGYDVVSLNYPKPIIKLIKTESADLVISDIIMQGLDGYSLCKEIKEIYQNKILVILCTAKPYEKDLIEKAHKEFGADDFIFKPFKPEELLEKVKGVLEKKEKPS